MKAKDLIKQLSDMLPNDDTELDILLFDTIEGKPFCDFLDIHNIVWNADCSGINAIGINVRLSHKLDDQ